jgi:hypothetical protein
MDTNRSFKLLHQTVNGNVEIAGRYIGTRPKQAAYKALTAIHKIYKNENIENESSVFGMVETTRSSKKKIYWYVGKKEKTNEPIELYKLNDKYFSKNKINELGGFEKIFGKKEDEVKPNILCSYSNSVRRANKNEHLQLYENAIKSGILNEPNELQNDYNFDEGESGSSFSLISNDDTDNEYYVL